MPTLARVWAGAVAAASLASVLQRLTRPDGPRAFADPFDHQHELLVLPPAPYLRAAEVVSYHVGGPQAGLTGQGLKALVGIQNNRACSDARLVSELRQLRAIWATFSAGHVKTNSPLS